MRLFLSGNSKFNIGYTPDAIEIYDKDKTFTYDVMGWTDYSNDSLSTRTKGDNVLVLVGENDLVKMTRKKIEKLIQQLKSKDCEKVVAIYPSIENEENEKLGEDEITDCEGTFCYYDEKKKENIEVDFKFRTVFYGI